MFNVWQAGVPSETKMQRVMVSTQEGFHTDSVQVPVEKGKLMVSMLPQSAMVLKHKNKAQMKRRVKLM